MNTEQEAKLRDEADKFRSTLKDHYGKEDDLDAFTNFAKSEAARQYWQEQNKMDSHDEFKIKQRLLHILLSEDMNEVRIDKIMDIFKKEDSLAIRAFKPSEENKPNAFIGKTLKVLKQNKPDLEELDDIRNELYDSLPKGDISSWDLLNIIRDHIIKLDDFILSKPYLAQPTESKDSFYAKSDLRNLLEDVVNELNLSESAIEKHGPLGTEPAKLVSLVLDEKDRTIDALKSGMKMIETKSKESDAVEFAEWILKNNWYKLLGNYWTNGDFNYKSEQLYVEFKNTKGK